MFLKLWNWLKQAKISPWKTTTEEMQEAVKLPGAGRVGSYEEQHPILGARIQGIKITVPLPEPPQGYGETLK